MKKHTFAIGLLTLVLPMTGYSACTQLNNTVGFMGLDSKTGDIYLEVAGHDNNCQCNSYRFKSTNTETNKVLSILMAARFAKQKLRIDIDVPGDCNTADRVYLQSS